MAYFNKNYVNTEIFSRNLGKRVVESSKVREDSDYDDEYVAKPEATESQIETAEELIYLVEKYIESQK